MRNTLSKTLAVLMVCVTAIGLILSIFILIQIWRYRQPVYRKLQTGVDQMSAILQTTGEGLNVIDLVIKNVYSTTLYLDDTTNALAKTVQSTNLFIDSAGTFVGEDLINTITNTQQTLDSAQASALVIDNILSTLSRVPLIGIDYNPAVPLNIALGEVADSLTPLQSSLKGFQFNLEATGTNMEVFTDQILVLDQNITAINKNLLSSQAVIDDYQLQVSSLQSLFKLIEASLSNYFNTIIWILSLIILWLVLIQLSILLQGASLLTHFHAGPEETSQS